MALELTGLVTTQNTQVSQNPRLGSTTVLITTNLPTQCIGNSNILGIVKSQPTVDSYFSLIKLSDTITNLQNFRDSLIASRADTLRQLPTNNQSVEAVRTYMNQLHTSVLPYYRLVNNCIKEQKEARWDEWNEQKESTHESKERYDSVMHPELKVSYYEGWFPIFRPMTETSLFFLFAIGSFLILFSLAFFLRMGGVEFDFKLPFTSDSTSFFESYKPYLVTFGITSVVFASIILGVGYSKGWFDKNKE
jgi:hypothetical protein